MCVCMYVCMYLCIYVCIDVCMYDYIYSINSIIQCYKQYYSAIPARNISELSLLLFKFQKNWLPALKNHNYRSNASESDSTWCCFVFYLCICFFVQDTYWQNKIILTDYKNEKLVRKQQLLRKHAQQNLFSAKLRMICFCIYLNDYQHNFRAF